MNEDDFVKKTNENMTEEKGLGGDNQWNESTNSTRIGEKELAGDGLNALRWTARTSKVADTSVVSTPSGEVSIRGHSIGVDDR